MKDNVQLYIVPTPIGNLSDITLRAIEVLKSVDFIACEDSRVTQKLLNHYDIKTKTISYHKFNEKERIDFFLNLFSQGKKIALVSDAGMPLICDPGAVLVNELKDKNIKISALPGANAFITFLAQIPKTSEQFSFVGFLPKTEAQILKTFQQYQFSNLVFYDSPNRLLKTLNYIQKFDNNAKVAIGRELTKVFEEVIVDDIKNIIEYYKTNVLKGEIVVMIYAKSDENPEQADITNKIKALQQKDFSAKDISVILSTLYGLNKNEIYKRII